jgi:hypothetical protein
MSFIVDSKQEKEPIAVIPEEDVDLSREQATAVFCVFQEYSPMLRAIRRLGKIWVHLDVQDGMLVLKGRRRWNFI